MSDKLYAYYELDCEKCGIIIYKDDEFKIFAGSKICIECWGKLVTYFEEEM